MREVCFFCKGTMEKKNVTLDLRIEGKLIVIENVPAQVCSQCGESVLIPETGEKVEKLVKESLRSKKKFRTISVPVMDLAKVS